MKIRLMGASDELSKFKKAIKKIPGIDIINMSEPYANRGISIEQRIYLECRLNTVYMPADCIVVLPGQEVIIEAK